MCPHMRMCMCMCMCMHMPLLATALTALGPSSGRAAPAFLIHQHPRGAGSALLCANATLEAPRKPRVVTRFFTLRVASLTAGIVGAFASAFVVVEGWPVVDALYFTATTFATIGFGDLKPVRPAGRLLTSMCGVAGVGEPRLRRSLSCLAHSAQPILPATRSTRRAGERDSGSVARGV